MYSLIESIRLAFNSIRAHGLRSLLTTLGIIIGVASIIAVVAIVQGMSYAITSQFEDLGSKNVTIAAETSMAERQLGKWNRITPRDVELLRARLSNVRDLVPTTYLRFGTGTQVRFGDQSATPMVVGTTSSYQNVNRADPRLGRFLTPADDRARRKVAVIGQKVLDDLKIPGEPIGKYLEIGSEWFKIVGVMEAKGEIFGFSQDNYVLLPYEAVLALNGFSNESDIQISIELNDPNQFEEMKAQARMILRQAHGLRPSQGDDFTIKTAQQLSDSVSKVTDTITLVMGGIVGVSLLVGGIGIMNIMLVSVTERTREIGISKALGAKRHHILLQFLVEAVVLSLCGGLIGLAFGYLIGFAIASAFPVMPDVVVPLWAVALALGFSAAVGVLFGIAPAAKAARLDPIEALRHE